jgi:hypothetical protein
MHVAKQQRVIDEANRATSVAPPGLTPPSR